MRRSMLFLPGNTPNMLINGSALGADAVIFDLEDAVSPAEKDAARILVRNTLRYGDMGRCETIVRVNSIDTDFFKKDIDAVLPEKPNLIMLPKTSCGQDVLTADEYITEVEKKLGLDGTFQSAIDLAQIRKAQVGDTDASRFVRDTVGEKPREGLEIGNLADRPFETIDLSQMSDAQLRELAAAKRGNSD